MTQYFSNFSALFLVAILNISCFSQKESSLNGKWIYDFGDCQDYILFKKNNEYEFYSCESGDTIFGKYYMESNRIIYLEQLSGGYDKDFNDNSRHRTAIVKFKLIINHNNLKFKERWELNAVEHWQKSDFKFPSDYVFKKAK